MSTCRIPAYPYTLVYSLDYRQKIKLILALPYFCIEYTRGYKEDRAYKYLTSTTLL